MCALPRPTVADRDEPWPKAEAIPLFHREIRERLSPTALALLLARAEIYVEGGTATGRSAKGAFMGSAMLTLDLSTTEGRLRPPHDTRMAERLAAALADDPGARMALVARALEATRERLSVPCGLEAGEPKIRVDGARVHVDLELEGRS